MSQIVVVLVYFVFIPSKLQGSSDSSTDLKFLFAIKKSYNEEDSNLEMDFKSTFLVSHNLFGFFCRSPQLFGLHYMSNFI